MDKTKYKIAEENYKILKHQLDKNELTAEQMKLELKKLLIKDEIGQYWMLGEKTGQWYFYNEKEWKIGIPYEESNIICPFCNENIEEGATRCNHCNRMLSVPVPAELKTMICPFCKEEIKDGAMKCKHCKSILNDSIKILAEGLRAHDPYKTQRRFAIGMIIFGIVYLFISGMGPYKLTILPNPIPAIMVWTGIIWLIIVSTRKKKIERKK